MTTLTAPKPRAKAKTKTPSTIHPDHLMAVLAVLAYEAGGERKALTVNEVDSRMPQNGIRQEIKNLQAALNTLAANKLAKITNPHTAQHWPFKAKYQIKSKGCKALSDHRVNQKCPTLFGDGSGFTTENTEDRS